MPTLKQIKESEAVEAIGGMRDPARSLHRVPGACVVGEKIRRTLDEFISDHENTRTPVERILEGLPTLGFEADEVLAARAAIWATLDIQHPAKPVASSPICS